MAPHRFNPSSRRGIAYLLVLIAVAAGFTLACGLLTSQGMTLPLSRNMTHRAEAKTIAETGLQMAMAYVMSDPNWRNAKPQGAWVQNQSFGGGTFTIQGYGNGSFTDPAGAVILVATGMFKGATYKVQAVLSPTTFQVNKGISVVSNITMSTGTKVDSYDSSLGAYGGSNVGDAARVATNSTQTGAVNLGTGAKVSGNVYVGPGSDPNKVVKIGTGAKVTGTKENLSDPQSMPAIAVPDLGAVQPAVSYAVGSNTVLSNDLHVASLSIGTGGKVQINGDVTIVTEGNFTINTGARVEVLANSSLKVYCKGTLTMSTGADNKVIGPNLTRLTFYNVGTNTAKLNTGGSLQGVLISPNADVQATTGFRLYGAVLAKNLSLGTGTAFHEDTKITSGADAINLPTTGNSGYQVEWVSTW
jgi:hypothetical protein